MGWRSLVRGSPECGVVQNYVLPVSGRADVQFESHRDFETTGESRQRIFRCMQK